MNKSELIKFTAILFHIISLGFLFIGLSLILDWIFDGNSVSESGNQIFLDMGSEIFLGIIACVFGMMSVFLISRDWIKKGKLELYMGSIFTAEIFLIIGIVLLLTLT